MKMIFSSDNLIVLLIVLSTLSTIDTLDCIDPICNSITHSKWTVLRVLLAFVFEQGN